MGVPITALAEPLVGSPLLKSVSLKCANCIHFARVPIVDIKGGPLVCGSATVGRQPTSAPCAQFKINGLKMQDLPKGIQAQARKLISAFDADITYKNAKEEAVVVLVGWLSVYAYSLRKGLPLGSKVRVQGSDVSGELIHIDSDYAWIIDPAKDASIIVGDKASASGKKGVRCQVEAKLVYLDPEALAEKKAAGKKKPAKKAPAKKAAGKKKPAAKKAAGKKKPAAKKASEKKPAKKAPAKKAASKSKNKVLGKGLAQMAAAA